MPSRFNDAFWRWFGDSVVVDENDDPLVVYHASWSRFEAFRTQASEMGAHFGSLQQARSIVAWKFLSPNRRRQVMLYPVYLSIENPLRLTDWGQFKPRFVARQLLGMGWRLPFETDDATVEVVQRFLKRKGFDGIVYLNRREAVWGTTGGSVVMSDEEFLEHEPEAQDSWIVFDSWQVKSVRNRGTWDPADPNVMNPGDYPQGPERGLQWQQWWPSAPMWR